MLESKDEELWRDVVAVCCLEETLIQSDSTASIIVNGGIGWIVSHKEITEHHRRKDAAVRHLVRMARSF